jgi:hypothetical protein
LAISKKKKKEKKKLLENRQMTENQAKLEKREIYLQMIEITELSDRL